MINLFQFSTSTDFATHPKLFRIRTHPDNIRKYPNHIRTILVEQNLHRILTKVVLINRISTVFNRISSELKPSSH